jgi:hypothetical protein
LPIDILSIIMESPKLQGRKYWRPNAIVRRPFSTGSGTAFDQTTAAIRPIKGTDTTMSAAKPGDIR